jgi:hypothetical protein
VIIGHGLAPVSASGAQEAGEGHDAEGDMAHDHQGDEEDGHAGATPEG